MEWEFEVLYALQGLHTPALDAVMTVLSTLGNAGVFWIAVSLALCVPRSTRRIGLQMCLTMAIAYLIGNLILKNLIARQRPCWLDPSVTLLIASPTDYSFPSGHSLNGFAASTALYCQRKRAGTAALFLASLIAFSRLYHFVHFPTDVAAGIALGVGTALVVDVFLNRRRKMNEK